MKVLTTVGFGITCVSIFLTTSCYGMEHLEKLCPCFLYADVYCQYGRCICSGPKCRAVERTNECLTDPCLNGATCTDYFGYRECHCKIGYKGSNCYDIDECSSNPCVNGTCVDGIGSYKCVCNKGYTGHDCAYDIDECSSNPCVHGTCVDGVASYKCVCDKGYTGYDCVNITSDTIKPTILLDSVKLVSEGTSRVVVPCYAEGVPVPTVTWKLVNGALPVNARQLLHYLVVENVTMADDGFYMCRASNELGQDIQVLHLTVKAKPTRKHTPPTITAPSTVQANYSSSVNLMCIVTGYPKPMISWIHNNQKIAGTSAILSIHKADNTTQGVYTCSATNDAGNSSADIMLKVVHEIPKITEPPKPTVVNAGSNHSFICKASGVPVPSVTWSFQPFGQTATTLQLTGTNISLVNMQKSGVLSCMATNQFGMDHAQANVIVVKGFT